MISPPLRPWQNACSDFQRYYETIAQPFEWRFTRQDLMDLLERIKKHPNSHSRCSLKNTLVYL